MACRCAQITAAQLTSPGLPGAANGLSTSSEQGFYHPLPELPHRNIASVLPYALSTPEFFGSCSSGDGRLTWKPFRPPLAVFPRL